MPGFSRQSGHGYPECISKKDSCFLVFIRRPFNKNHYYCVYMSNLNPGSFFMKKVLLCCALAVALLGGLAALAQDGPKEGCKKECCTDCKSCENGTKGCCSEAEGCKCECTDCKCACTEAEKPCCTEKAEACESGRQGCPGENGCPKE